MYTVIINPDLIVFALLNDYIKQFQVNCFINCAILMKQFKQPY